MGVSIARSSGQEHSSRKASRPYPTQCIVTLAEAGLVPFPAASSRRSGSIEDLNVHRICRTINQAFLDSLPRMGPFTAKQVQALMTTFLTTRVGYEGEDLQRRLEYAAATEVDGWFRFAVRTISPDFHASPPAGFPWLASREFARHFGNGPSQRSMFSSNHVCYTDEVSRGMLVVNVCVCIIYIYIYTLSLSLWQV